MKYRLQGFFSRTLILTFSLLVTLSGCSSIPIFSMVKLSQLDPFAMDPNQVKIAVISHKAMRVQKGDVRMSLGKEIKNWPKCAMPIS